MNSVNIILYAMAAILVILVFTAALVLFVYLAEWMGCDIPNWMKKIKR